MSRAGDLKAVFDALDESVLCCDESGRITAWNRAATTLYGWTAAEAIGQFADKLLLTHVAGEPVNLAKSIASAPRWRGRLQRTTRAGDTVFVDARVTSASKDGQPNSLVEISQLIDEVQNRSEEDELREYRYRTMFGAMAVGFWEVDFTATRDMLLPLRSQGVTDLRQYLLANSDFVREAMSRARVLDVNAKTVDLFGATCPEDMIGFGVERYWPAESEFVFVESLVSSMDRRPFYVTETKLLTLDGRLIDVLFTVAWSPEVRRRAVLLLGIVDVNERNRAYADLERSEQRYRNLMSNAPIAVWEMNSRALREWLDELRASGVQDIEAYAAEHPTFIMEAMRKVFITEANQRALAMFKARNGEELAGPVTRIWEDHPKSFERAVFGRYGGADHYEGEGTFTTLTGETVDVLFSISFPKPAASYGTLIVAAVDLTERNRAESERRRAEQALSKVQSDFAHAARVSMLGELTASIAHEVNQPLAAISTQAQASLRWLTRSDPDFDELKALSQRIVDDAQRASDIISRIRQMAIKRDPEVVELAPNALIQEALLIVQHELQARSISVQTRFARPDARVRGDRVQLLQVLVNLIVNAAQALSSLDSDRRLTLEVTSLARDVAISIEDNGPGIDPDHRNQLFTGFFTTKPSGMGMGLSISRSIIEAHGGRIEVSDRVPGARFTIYIPQCAAKQDEGWMAIAS